MICAEDRQAHPAAEALIAIDKLYGVSPRDLDSDPIEFAQKLADPDRMKKRVEAIERKRGAKVVPIEKGTKR